MAVIRISEGQRGATVEAKVGDTLELTLPENATTGFQWEPGETSGVVAIETSELVPPNDARAGAAATRHVVARAMQPGNDRLTLRLRRSWEPPEKTEDTFTVEIAVA